MCSYRFTVPPLKVKMRAETNDEAFDKNNGAADQGGITVVDIYSEWSGPCTAMQTALKKIKLEVKTIIIILKVMTQ